MAQVQPCAIADDLGVEGRFAIGEPRPEAEFLAIECAGSVDVGDEKLGLGKGEEGFCCIRWCAVRHGLKAFLQRLPVFEARLPGNQFLGIGKLEAVIQDLAVGQMAEARQYRSDRIRDGIVPLAMPAQVKLGLFPLSFRNLACSKLSLGAFGG